MKKKILAFVIAFTAMLSMSACDVQTVKDKGFDLLGKVKPAIKYVLKKSKDFMLNGTFHHLHTTEELPLPTSPCVELVKQGRKCKECGEITEPQEVLENHAWDKGVVIQEATAEAEGILEYTCTVEGCGAKKQAPIQFIVE